MARRKASELELERPRPAISPDAREEQLIALAIDRVEQRLIDGTASSQEIVHFLKLATERAKIENEKLKHETELLEAKTRALESQQHSEELYANAIRAMRDYSGDFDEDL